MICCVEVVAFRATCPCSTVNIFAWIATSCAVILASAGLFGLSVRPGPVRKSSHPPHASASENATHALVYRLIAKFPRDCSVVEPDGHDKGTRQWVVEPVDTA